LTFVILQLLGFWTTPVARLIFVEPGVKIKPIKDHHLFPHAHLSDTRAYFSVEPVPVNAEVTRRIPEANTSWLQLGNLWL
jgi:hypothetical protein